MPIEVIQFSLFSLRDVFDFVLSTYRVILIRGIQQAIADHLSESAKVFLNWVLGGAHKILSFSRHGIFIVVVITIVLKFIRTNPNKYRARDQNLIHDNSLNFRSIGGSNGGQLVPHFYNNYYTTVFDNGDNGYNNRPPMPILLLPVVPARSRDQQSTFFVPVSGLQQYGIQDQQVERNSPILSLPHGNA